MATVEQTTALLNEARQAYHDLAIGVQVRVIVNQNGTRVEYTPANRNALKVYIAELEQELGVSRARGPMRLVF